MTAIATPPRVLDIDDFIAEYAHREERFELVEGVPVMVPFEDPDNCASVGVLTTLSLPVLGTGYRYESQAGLYIPSPDGIRHTIRVPDFVLRARTPDHRATRGDLHRATRGDLTGVRLVAELVSDSSVETDWVSKRRDYAAAGVPVYLVVDVRDEHPRLYAFDTIIDGRYADPTGDGTRVDLHIDHHHVTITADDIAERL